MEERVEPLAHDDAFLELHLDLVSVERLDEQAADDDVEAGGVEPAWDKSLAHDGSEVALLDVKHVGCGENGACEVSRLEHSLGVVQSVDNLSLIHI